MSSLTGKIFIYGQQKVALGYKLQGNFSAQVDYTRKTTGALKLWSSIRRGFPAQVFREAGFIVH